MIHKSELVKILVTVTQFGTVDSQFQIFNRVLLEKALVRLDQGEVFLTEKGKRFLFQWECERFLQALQDGRQPQDSDDVVHWLTKHHFVVKAERSGPALHMTRRGRDWLSQLEESIT